MSRLGDTLNDLLDRLEASAERERQFLADASHELRSPLALMRTELEWHRHRPRSDAETATVLASMQDQVQRLVDLANALLDIEELRGAGPIPREPVPATCCATRSAVRRPTGSTYGCRHRRWRCGSTGAGWSSRSPTWSGTPCGTGPRR